MKEVDKKYAYDLKDLSYSQLEILAHKFDTKLIASHQIKEGTFEWMNNSRKEMLLFLYNPDSKSWVFREYHPKELVVNALSLFEVDSKHIEKFSYDIDLEYLLNKYGNEGVFELGELLQEYVINNANEYSMNYKTNILWKN